MTTETEELQTRVATGAHIIVVDDDPVYRTLIATALRTSGHRVEAVQSASELYCTLIECKPDIVVLDIDMPGDDGHAAARRLRALGRTRRMGIIMLTGRAALDERVRGLAAGADVYLTKPVYALELNAYVGSLLRRLEGTAATEAGHCAWMYSPRKQELSAPSGKPIPLTHREARFIEILVEQAGVPVRRRDIITRAFREDPLQFDDRRLDTLVSRLKKKIRAAYCVGQPIKSAHAYGYMFSEGISVL